MGFGKPEEACQRSPEIVKTRHRELEYKERAEKDNSHVHVGCKKSFVYPTYPETNQATSYWMPSATCHCEDVDPTEPLFAIHWRATAE